MNVLSLFDGMSCGQIALDKLGVGVKHYYAAEIDKYAMSIAKKNYPNTIHLGDVTEVKGEDLPRIDLLMGGSPCQGFSFAGKQLNFDDPRSALFFEFVRLLKETKPKYFLLENVRMKQEYQDVISEHLGVKPIMINSALVSAQNRVRLYWTNIPNIEQPEDKGIALKDVLENHYKNPVIDQYPRGVNKGGMRATNGKTPSMTTSGWQHNNHLCEKSYFERPCTLRQEVANSDSECHHVATADDINGHDCIKRVYAESGKSPTLNACTGGNREPKVLVNESETKKGKAYALTHSYTGAVAWNSIERKQRTMIPTHESTEKDPNIYNGVKYRKLTPMECERLQTVPDGYTEGVSNTQRYKMLGNGWTVDVITHILKGMEFNKEEV